jgi:hypothetical protein
MCYLVSLDSELGMKVEKKLRECEFFLNHMREHERLAFGDREPFDFYLSAFLNASRSVDYRLCHENKARYPEWRKAWNGKLSAGQRELIKFFVDDRNVEVHESGSSRIAKNEDINIGNFYSDSSGTLMVSGPPGMTGATIQRPAYFVTINASERKATDACTEYLSLLHQMVGDFRASKP